MSNSTSACAVTADSIQDFVQACAGGDVGTVQRMLSGNPLLAAGWQPLLEASRNAHADVVTSLLEFGANPDARSTRAPHHRPLHRAIEHKRSAPRQPGHVRVVRALLDGGADITLRASELLATPIALAAMSAQKQFLPLLLPHLSSWDIFTAAVLGEARHVKTMLQRDPTLATAVDRNGMTALHYCAASRLGGDDLQMGRQLADIANALLDAGAEIDVAYRVGTFQTLPPICWAAGNPSVLHVLLERSADPTPGLAGALVEGLFDVAELLLRASADIHHPTIARLVSTSAKSSQYATSRWLMEHGADPNSRDTAGRTALHWACSRGANPQFVQVFLQLGADPGLHDADGATPLDLAKARNRTKLVELLEKTRD